VVYRFAGAAVEAYEFDALVDVVAEQPGVSVRSATREVEGNLYVQPIEK
jgi:hypothetical protein